MQHLSVVVVQRGNPVADMPPHQHFFMLIFLVFISPRVHMVSPLTVLITQTFLVGHSGTLKGVPPPLQFLDLISSIGSLCTLHRKYIDFQLT